MSRQIKAPQRCNYAFLFAHALSVAKKKKNIENEEPNTYHEVITSRL